MMRGERKREEGEEEHVFFYHILYNIEDDFSRA
jgi:hypothetical protein